MQIIRKREFLFLTVVLALLIMIYTAYDYYDKRHLRKVEALLQIDNRIGATQELEAHIVNHPDSYQSKFHLALLKATMGDPESAIRIMGRMGSQHRFDEELSNTNTDAGRTISRLIAGSMEELESLAIEDAIKHDLSEAKRYAEFLELIVERKPILTATFTTSTAAKGLASTIQNISMHLAYADLCKARALVSYIDWLKGDYLDVNFYSQHGIDKNVATLDSAFFARNSTWYFQSKLASLANDEAHRRFEAENWSGAYDAYKFVRDRYLRCIEDHKTDSTNAIYRGYVFAGEPQLNMAICKSNAGEYSEALEELSVLKNSFPESLVRKSDRDYVAMLEEKFKKYKK